MYLWKPLLAILPAGLALGAVGGHMARPVLTQRAGDEPWQAMFQGRGGSDGTQAYPPQIEGPRDYDGGFSYAPNWATQDKSVGWTSPAADSFAYYDAKLPTVAELDARQTALLADPEKEYATKPQAGADAPTQPDVQLAAADSSSDGPDTVLSARPADVAPEPQTADGQPAIW